MAYEKSLDIAQMERAFSTANGTLTIGIYSYNGGEPKLRIVRQQKRKDKVSGQDYLAPSKLGGLSIAETIALKDSFVEAINICARLQQNNAAPTPVTQPTAPQVPVTPQMPTMTPIAPAAQPLPPHAVAQPVAPNTIRRIQI